jgi:hypothetical protein
MGEAERVAFAEGLMLLATSLDKDIDSAQVAVYWHHLKTVPAEVRREVFTLASGMKWFGMPQPGELKALAAGVMQARRKAAAALHLESCTHSSHWIDTDKGLVRCPCWTQAKRAMDAVGQPIVLPERTED